MNCSLNQPQPLDQARGHLTSVRIDPAHETPANANHFPRADKQALDDYLEAMHRDRGEEPPPSPSSAFSPVGLPVDDHLIWWVNRADYQHPVVKSNIRRLESQIDELTFDNWRWVTRLDLASPMLINCELEELAAMLPVQFADCPTAFWIGVNRIADRLGDAFMETPREIKARIFAAGVAQ